jgi:ribosome recycling factor
MSLTGIQDQCDESMGKTVEYLVEELRGIRTGQATPGLVDHIKIEVPSYGSTMNLRDLASISVPEPVTIVIKPFDPGVIKDIERGLQTSDLGITPMNDGKVIRLPIPPLSGERRDKLVVQVKKMGEAQKVSVRNVRRDMNKRIDAAKKDDGLSEDDVDSAKESIQKKTKSYEIKIDKLVSEKVKDVQET